MLSLRAGEGREVMQDFRMSDFRNKAILAAVEAEVGPLRTQIEEAQAERDTAIKRGVEFYRQVKARGDGWGYAFQCRQERIRGLVAENERQRADYAEADWARSSLQALVDEQLGQLDVAQSALHKYGRHHDNCEGLKRKVRSHHTCTCGYIAARHRADPDWLSGCKQCAALRGEPSQHGG